MSKTSTSCTINTLERALSCQFPNINNYEHFEHFTQNIKENNRLPIVKPIKIRESSNQEPLKSKEKSKK